MISSFFHLILGICLFILKAIELFYQIASVTSLRIVIILSILVYALSRYFRLKQPILPQNLVDAICGNQHISNQATDEQEHQQSNLNQWWPIANRAGCLDSIENSRSAIEKCVAQSCRNVLLDVNTTKCGQLVILHEQTLYRLEYGIMNGTVSSEKKIQSKTKNINSMKFEELNSLNLARNHPLCEKYPHESIMHFNDLMQLLDVHEKLNIFLLTGSTSNKIVSITSRYFENNPERFKRIVICSRSPWFIYQLRKRNPHLVCALWLDRISNLRLPSVLLNSTFFLFVYGLIIRNIIAVITGISAVFISKHDFNAHLSQMWNQSNVQPIAYTLNSPSEKRYFQQTLRTQYLTDSLRSEPHHFIKLKK